MPLKHKHIAWRQAHFQEVEAVNNMGKLGKRQSIKLALGEAQVRSGMGSHFVFPSAGLETKWNHQQEADCAALIPSCQLSGRLSPPPGYNPCGSSPPPPPNRSPPCLPAAHRPAVIQVIPELICIQLDCNRHSYHAIKSKVT